MTNILICPDCPDPYGRKGKMKYFCDKCEQLNDAVNEEKSE